MQFFQDRHWRWKVALGATSLALVGLGYLCYLHATAGCPALRGTVVLAGTNPRLSKIVESGDCHGPLDGTGMLWSDLIIIVGYWLFGTLVIASGWWRYQAPALRRLLPVVVWLPTGLALLDVAEDLFLVSSLETSTAIPMYGSNVLASIIFGLAWTKWSLVVLTLVAVIMSAAVWYSRRAEKYSPGHRSYDLFFAQIGDPHLHAMDSPPDGADPELDNLVPHTVGICFSGGGIRSAAFSLGALHSLEEGARPGSVTDQARYIAAVSGGSWAATAWTIERAQLGQAAPVAEPIFDRLTTPGGRKGFQPQKFLANGRLSINGLIAWAVVCSAVNIALVALLVFLVAWPLGFGMSTSAMRPELPVASSYQAALPDGGLLLTIAVVITSFGALIVVGCGFFRKVIATKWVAGAAVAGLGIFTWVYLTWLPALFITIAGVGPGETPDKVAATSVAAGAIATSLAASVAAGVWRVISGPVTKQVTGLFFKLLPRLVGVFIVLGWLAWACVAMYYAARRYYLDGFTIIGWNPSSGVAALLVWSVALIVTIGLYVFLNPNWPTLHNVYASRLTATFDSTPEGERWDTLAAVSKPAPTARVPELILCCAQEREGIAEGGLRAESFTISPHWVRQGKRTVPRPSYEEVTTSISKVRPRFSNGFRRLDYVAPWLATTGAAFASAMGRQSLGSANALLATVNADLGVWLPNPIVVQDECIAASVGEPAAATFVGAAARYAHDLRTAAPTAKGIRDVHRARVVDDTTEKKWRRLLPKPRFAYILKEIVGWYDQGDRYTFITDGGHWDNLGLVELLRRKCDVIYCIDASGDLPGTFSTLRQALDLESLELGQLSTGPDLDTALCDILPKSKSLPMANATSFNVMRQNGELVAIHYAKLQATQGMPAELRRFAVADRQFPHYSTARQFLNAKQFENLYKLGQFAGQQVIASAMSFEVLPPTTPLQEAQTRAPEPITARGDALEPTPVVRQ